MLTVSSEFGAIINRLFKKGQNRLDSYRALKRNAEQKLRRNENIKIEPKVK